MEAEKNRWIEETMDSFLGKQEVEPPARLYSKIMDKVSRRGMRKRIPVYTVSAAAAVVFILISFNVYSLLKLGSISEPGSALSSASSYYSTVPPDVWGAAGTGQNETAR
jgi:hypothetical protein